MKEKVGNAILNYKFYGGSDAYSDGSIEDELLEMVSAQQDVIKILKQDDRWPVLYHLSPVRQNIVEWYPMKEDAKVLEIGAGCGAITGALCRQAKQVVCIELSKRRSLINANRNQEYDNLEIFVGNFNDVVLEQKFDYITLIGVLEYAAYYTDTANPFVDFLKKIRKYLKPDGKVLIAIENKYGLKYWSGSREDHTGIFFDGIEGYHATSSQVRTFSKTELEKILEEAGYEELEFYYPFPDYKFPTQIFSEKYMPQPEDVTCGRDSYDAGRMYMFNETLAYRELIASGDFAFFANSFMVEAK
ncbi:MAG: class I SAM-dependent methyltransferase [Lachnospiraceae bacterium]